MQQVAKPKKGYKRLKIAGSLILLLIAGFFVYKYSYIHIERRKYDQATVAINKVAADLRAQGIETTFSRGCQFSNPESSTGSLGCSVNLVYSSNQSAKESADVLVKMYTSLKSQKAIFADNINDKSFNSKNDFSVDFKFTSINLSCNISYSDHSQNDYSTGVYCGSLSRFPIY
ncbi:MAG: hypothetical protein JWO47_840 [Candidatus Saccharibacteria bacterium]|nr:hypothetical protein [Candidatus Saccharibacteria bacterium]